MGQQAFQMVLFLQNIAKELRMLSNSTIQSSLLSEQLKKTSNVSLGEAQKQIFSKSWEFGPTGLTPPPPPRTLGFSVNFSEIFGKKG